MKFPVEKWTRYALAICRIEPENNPHLILEAFSGNAALPCVVVGNWNKSEYGKKLKRRYRDDGNVALLDPVYDLAELDVLRSRCTLYLHGHGCGGTNPSLVEAMYVGLPVAAFDVNFNRETTENAAFYFSDAAGLRALVADLADAKLAAVAARMREIAHRRYVWKRIADLYAEVL
ncbi:MAG: glycosyltransferase [Victivallaceae bacterium]|nr:glycosyltransferase [Victivallaceae bacterium]